MEYMDGNNIARHVDDATRAVLSVPEKMRCNENDTLGGPCNVAGLSYFVKIGKAIHCPSM